MPDGAREIPAVGELLRGGQAGSAAPVNSPMSSPNVFARTPSVSNAEVAIAMLCS